LVINFRNIWGIAERCKGLFDIKFMWWEGLVWNMAKRGALLAQMPKGWRGS
jgi:hypothetical protein